MEDYGRVTLIPKLYTSTPHPTMCMYVRYRQTERLYGDPLLLRLSRSDFGERTSPVKRKILSSKHLQILDDGNGTSHTGPQWFLDSCMFRTPWKGHTGETDDLEVK